jgi:group II intron reverse transcriptase/maturase
MRLKEILKNVPQEDLKDIERLEVLRKLNANREWKNTDVYRYLYKRGLYHVAYQRLKSKPGNMTPGADPETLDGYSLKLIEKTIDQLRDESYQPKPVRASFIPKANGKLRKLGIPSPRDKMLQEVMRMVMEAIYDSPHGSTFEETSHGFRRNRSPHTALREIRRKWSGVNFFIEGDIKSCFDEIDHERLVEIIGERISDQRFLNLVRKLLKSGYIDREWRFKNTLIGTPQGGILSPLLANVFLDKLDKYVEKLREEYERGEAKRANRAYRTLADRKQKLAKQGLARTKEFRQIVRQMRELPSRDPNDENFIRIKYVRYADDWLIGIIGSRQIAEEIKEKIREFLQNELKLTLSPDKTKITHAKTEQAEFLGTLISIGRSPKAKQKTTLSTNASGKYFDRRSTGWETMIRCPTDKLIKRLAEKGFCDATGKPSSRGAYVDLDADQIISKYSAINRGLQNYYRPCDNFQDLRRVQYVLKYSLAKTLAEKFRKSVAQVFRKGEILAEYTTSKGEVKQIKFYQNHNWHTDRDAFNLKDAFVDQVMLEMRLRTRSKLDNPCAICGETEDVEMHHVRHLRKMDERKKKGGFIRVMIALNRKQIPLCPKCHDKVHRGEYDGINLTDLKYDPR